MPKKMSGSDMLSGPLLGNIITYTLPVILTGVLQLLFNAADLVVVGRFCGSISVAAVGACSALTNLIVNFFIGLSIGSGVSVAHAIGAGKKEDVHRAVHTSIITALVSGVIITVVGVLFSGKFLRLMGTPENVLPLSTVYMRLYFAGALFLMIYNFCASILRAAGDTKSPLILLTIAGIINVILNVIFITVFDMNVAGVALATAISQAISAVLVVFSLARRTDACRLCFDKIRFYKAQFLKILRIGLPAGIQSSIFSLSNVIIQSSVNSFGDIFMSGNAAALNLEGFLWTILNSYQQAAVNFIAQNMGAKQYKRAKKVFWICLGCVLVTGIVMSSLLLFFGSHLLSIYITDSAEAISWGMLRLSILCFPYCICGLMDTCTGALRGIGTSLAPMIVSVAGVCGVRIGWVYTIFQAPQFHTPWCLYLSYVVSWVVTFAVLFVTFLVLFKKRSLAERNQT